MQLPVPNNTLTNAPLAAAYLKAYAHAQGLLEHVQIDILPRAIADQVGDALLVQSIVDYAPDLLGFSLYTWNSERSLAIAQRVRKHLPDLKVVVGGPEVQHDNSWLCEHDAIDFAIIGEGEHAFAELVREMLAQRSGTCTTHEPAAAISRPRLIHGTTLPDLSMLPSPYLLGYLEILPEAMFMVEVSRWCPYSCSFCLYGRNMGSKLGRRYFPLERLLAEIELGRSQGAKRIHFIEANLNLVPLFQPLMQALATMNVSRELEFYAELRAEHLSDEAVQALAQAGLREAEVGLQSANPQALQAVQRRTDLRKWAAGTQRLYQHGIDVLLDVIVGLPMDDEDGIQATLDFIEQEQLGPYDAFTLQVLPGTALRQHAHSFGLRFQERPPYYVLATDRLDFATLRRLRQTLKERAGIDPHALEGCPAPHYSALRQPPHARAMWGDIHNLAYHVDIIASWQQLLGQREWLCAAITANPSTIFDMYIVDEDGLPNATELRNWREHLPYQPGYLDRIAVYQRENPQPAQQRVSPRLFLLVPWTCEIDPILYAGTANLIWQYHLAANEQPPFAAWRAAAGFGVWVCGRTAAEVAAWREQSALHLWE